MIPEIQREAVRRLVADYKFKDNGHSWLQQGECPQCGKKELYTHVSAPWVIRCGRENKCGYQEHLRELYPDLFESWSDRFKQSDAAPNAAADAYLMYQRGFGNLSTLRGTYEQAYYKDQKLGISSSTVRFPIAQGIYWERIIDRPHRFGKKKAHFNYGAQWRGLWWHLPSVDPTTAEEIWIVEGIFDAIALALHGICAVAAFSCNVYPEKALADLASHCEEKRPTLVWALDGDHAGRKWTRKHRDTAEATGWKCAAAQIPQYGKKRDWNDLHITGELEENHLARYRYHGDLLLAKSAKEKACLIFNKTRQSGFIVEYENRTYWAKLNESEYKDELESIMGELNRHPDQDQPSAKQDWEAMQNAIACQEIASCSVKALYYMANRTTDESWYYFRVRLPDERVIKNTFTSGHLTSPSEFGKRLLHIAPGALFEGDLYQLRRLLRNQLSGIKTVETIDYVGYSKEHRCYVFNDIAVKDGKLLTLNEEDYFQADRKLSIKSISQSVGLHISTKKEEYQDGWLMDVATAFGSEGLVAAAWWLGSFFAEQIRARHKSYPFLEIVGEAGAGKTTLLEFLWKLAGRDHEGTDPSKSTTAARARLFSQVSNLPIGLIEADREGDGTKSKQFDWDELKTAYNGRSVRARGVKNNGNDTHEPPFRGAIVIAQNAPVDASEAIMQRIVHLYFQREGQNPASKAAADRLAATRIEDVSYFLLSAITREKQILETFFNRVPQCVDRIMARDDVTIPRIGLNHGQMMALLECLGDLLSVHEELITHAQQHVADMAGQRQRDLSADHPLVQHFWEIYDYLEDNAEPVLNHAAQPGQIAINLNHFAQVAINAKQQIPDLSQLKRHLRASRSRRFVDANRAISSKVFKSCAGTAKTVRCWVFQERA
ncbi:toprim domain-containing protein [Alloalcanivorax xenomutans]|uniref:toprim domain-containing protein n=1 Tax=Alloalcanivorax xenomutans TaxID=1094342 RepID=UPI003C4BAEBC